MTQGVQIQNTLSSAMGVNGNTEIQVTLTAPSDPAWQDADPMTPPNPNPLIATQLVFFPGVPSAFTMTGAPFNAFSSQPFSTNAHQFEMFLSGGALAGPTAPFYSFCMDLFHANPTAYAVDPDLFPSPPGLAANIGQIGYLYNEIGTNLLSPTNGTGLQLALYELVYDATPNLASGDFVVDQANTDPGAYAAALGYLAASSGKDQRSVFLNVTPPTPTGDLGRQGMIVTEKFNFANRPAPPPPELSITITPSETNEVGEPHTFTVTVLEDTGDGIDSDGDGSDFDPASNATVTVTLDGINGAVPDVSAPTDEAPADPTVVVGLTDSNGQFQVTFTSAFAGQVIGNASTTHTVNGAR